MLWDSSDSLLLIFILILSMSFHCVSIHPSRGIQVNQQRANTRQNSTSLVQNDSHKNSTKRSMKSWREPSDGRTRFGSSGSLSSDRSIGSVYGDQTNDGDTRVPFWNIAHMINSIDHIMPALEAGSNGIEVDISFDQRGFPVEAYHGFPCDCGRHCHHREELVKLVQYISRLTFPYGSSNLQLVLFDLKLKGLSEDQKKQTGNYLASILHEYLYKGYSDWARNFPRMSFEGDIARPPVRVIISINHVVDIVLVKSFIDHLEQNKLDYMRNYVGFDVGMNDNLTEIGSMWDQLNSKTLNIWQGDGLTNCANIVRGVERLKEALTIRNGQGHFRKIYYWTADVMYHIRSVLRLGIDAILTNQPQRVNQVLEEPEFKSKYRLATPFDDPFAQFWIKPSSWQMSIPSLEEAVETVSNIRETSANFVKTIPEGVSAVIKKVHKSITSRL